MERRARAFPRHRLCVALTATVALAGTTAATATADVTYSSSAAISIPDVGDASPYPSNIDVDAGSLTGQVQKATVTLRGFSHTCPDDVAVLLVGPSGANSILFAGLGPGMGCPASSNADLTFDQAAASGVPYPPITGTYKPTEGAPPHPFDPPAPAGPYPVTLDVFNGTAPSGTWKLFVHDESSGDSGSFSGGWSLKLTGPVPSNAFTLGSPTLNKKKGTATLPVTLPNPGELTGSGNGVKASSANNAVTSKSVGAGQGQLLIKARGRKKRKLNETGKVKLTVAVTYTPTVGNPPTSGAASTQTIKVKLKKRR